ncbi:metallophosphoesterase family protein [Peristeroidobacter soli]|uniref:hypothetical protein n=1 Tax=Peristeroidobacter soli TaxID=2497877 RepID=UPI001589EC00|nr:hypothetical protein [Peristeroidobacter soli]
MFHDEGTIETMNRLGLDFNAVGTHEFDDGKAELLRMQNGGCHPADPNTCQGGVVGTPVPFEGAKFKFLAANVVETATGKTIFPAYGIKVVNGVRVGFIGLTGGMDLLGGAQDIDALVDYLEDYKAPNASYDPSAFPSRITRLP